ncbi:hypothetical protein GCM10018787_30550 [Streptomyces thermodiastaticus]|nr:hypothetical protein GCM10018787_30550 [Streptomyces thermodiastaticus]
MGEACVVLDIGGVPEITAPTGWEARWEKRLGLPPGTVDERLDDVWRAGAVGTISEQEVREQVAARLGLDAPRTEAFMDGLWTEYLGTANEDLIASVRGLRGRCRLGILSNSFVGARERRRRRAASTSWSTTSSTRTRPGSANPTRARSGQHATRWARPRGTACSPTTPPLMCRPPGRWGMQAHLFQDDAATIARIAAHLDAGPVPEGPVPVG